MKFNKSKAFTLAEVLVTLAIIGVIAALTIPGLILNFQDQQFKVAWKQSYAILNAATVSALNDYGSFNGLFATRGDMTNKLKQYFSYSKECDLPTAGNCWATIVKRKNGANSTWGDTNGIVLNNGMFLRFLHSAQDCSSVAYFTTGQCGAYEIDTNGFKAPNVHGKDIFFIHILPDRLLPEGMPESAGSTVAANCATYGLGCGASLLLD